jgi:large subunit ribosomal protein L4
VKVDVTTVHGAKAGSADLPDAMFAITPNRSVLHQVVNAQLAAARSGTHSTKTRAAVQGGGAKPWRQKGTGRARHGSIRSPQWRGGGVAHGPVPRDHAQRTPKKMIKLALHSALSDRAADGRVMVVDEWGIDEPSTKRAVEILRELELRKHGERDPRVLLVLERSDTATWKSFRNLGPRLRIVLPEELNAYDVLVADWLVFSQATLDAFLKRGGGQ